MFEDIKRQILGEEKEGSALAKHLAFHEMYKSGGILEDLSDDVNLDERNRYIRSGLSSFVSDERRDDFERAVRERIGEEATQSAVEDIRSFGSSPGQKLKSLIREVSSRTKQAMGDADQLSIDDFVGTSLYKTFFESPRVVGDYNYKSLITESGTLASTLYKDLVSTDGIDDISYYLNNEGIDPDDRRQRDSFGYSIKDGSVNVGSSLDRRVFKTRYEIARSFGKTYKQYSMADAMDFLDPFLQRSNGFINKPGIAPFVSLIETSENFLDLDMFQFQNEYLADLYFNKILENSRNIVKGNFKVRIRIAGSDEGSKGETGFSILGPNKIQLERFALLRDQIINRLSNELIETENLNPDEALAVARNKVNASFQLVETDRKNHRKLFINEKLAVLGSANLTSPVGSSIYQEGSTYEAVRFFKRSVWADGLLTSSNGETSNIIREINRRKKGTTTFKDLLSEIRDNKLYRQVQQLNDRIHSDPTARLMQSGQRNIALSNDIYKHLTKTLTYALSSKGLDTKMKLMLDQPYLLQFGTAPYKGEMGTDPSLSNNNRESLYRTSIQDRLYKLIKADRAEIVVDVRNYREKVIDPLYKAIENLLGDEFTSRYDRNLEKLVDIGRTFDEREASLRSLFSSPSYSFSDKDGFSNVDQVIKQLLVVTSGSIKLSTQAKQHLKSYGLMRDNTLVSYYMGSSNLGPGSLAVSLRDQASNEELGLILDSLNRNRERSSNRSDWDLTVQEETEELISSTNNFLNQWNVLTNSNTGNSLVSRKASWEKDVDTKGLERLASNFREINEALGFEAIQINYLMGGNTGSKRIGLNIEINSSAITGMKNAPRVRYKFAALQYAPGDDRGGYVLAIDQSKAIGRSLFVNSREKESISMPFGIGDGRIQAGSSEILDSVQNTSIRIASMVGELAYKSMSLGPTQYLLANYGEDALASTFVGYMEYLATGRDTGGEWLVNQASKADIDLIIHKLRTQLYSSDKSNVRDLSNSSSSEIDRERKRQLDLVTAYLEDLKDTYEMPSSVEPGKELQHLRDSDAQRMQILANVVESWRRQNISLWQDLVLNTVNSFNDFGYESFINEQIRETSKYILEDAVTQGKQSSYGGAQGYMKLGLLGVSDNSQYDLANRKTGQRYQGIGNIFNFVRFMPFTYGPTSETYLPGAFRSVAEGGGSRPSSNLWGGISSLALARQEIGTIADVEIVNHMGAGYTTTVGQLQTYLSTLVGDNEAASLVKTALKGHYSSADSKIVTYMLSPGKVSQIAQRMKNFMGAQPLHAISDKVAEIIESERNAKSSSDVSLSQHLKSRMDDLKNDVATVLYQSNSASSNDLALKKADQIIDDSYVYSFLMSGGIRKVLSKEAGAVVEMERQAVIEELGLTDNLAITHKALVNELLRARLIRRDVISPGIKGFIGTPQGKPQVTYIQLGGAFSDYFQANPLYGGAHGNRQGFIDRQEKRLKASMLSNNWTDDRSKVIASEGDYVSYDRDRQRVVVVKGLKSGENGTVRSYPADNFSRPELDRLKGLVDSMSMRDVFADVADNQRLLSGESSFATYKTATWDSAGEDSIEYTLSSKWLTADPETNQAVFEMLLFRSKKPGGGSRFDATGSLFKGVAHFLHKDTVQLIMSRIQSSYSESEVYHAHDFKSVESRVDIHNVLGLGAPSHLKSYSFEHGASLLENKNLVDRTLSNTERHLTMSLLFGFGTGFIETRDSNVQNINKIKRLMYEKSIDGSMGSYYKEMAVKATLSANFNRKLNKAAEDYIRYEGSSLTSVSSVLEDTDIRKQLIAQVVSEDLMSNTAFSIESTPDLITFTSQEIIDALEDGTSNRVKERLRKLFNSSHIELNKKGYLLTEDPKQRSAINMMAAVDINLQLASQREVTGMPSDVELSLSNKTVLKQMAALMGGYDIPRISRDDEYAQQVIDNIRPMLSNYKVIALRTSNLFSESKVAMGKKYEANLELQYMMKNFTAGFKALRSGGSLSQIKKAVATIYKATSVTDELMVSDIEESLDMNIRNFHDLEFVSYGSKKSLSKNRFLGIYGGSSNLSTIKSYREAMIGFSEAKKERIKELAQRLRSAHEDRQNALSLSKNNPQRENSLRNAERSLIEIRDELLDIHLDINKRYEQSTIESELRDRGRELEADSEKGFGVGQAKNFLDAMETSGQRSFMFALPSISSVERDESNKGQLRISMDYSNPKYVFMPDAQMLKNLGVEFGSYIADELKYTMILSTGFAPGTTMSLIRDQMAINFAKGKNEVIINEDDYSKVQQYWHVASQMTHLLTMSASGTISKRAFANENRMPGLVSTAVGSFLVPENMAVVARAGLERHGLEMNPKRKSVIEGLNALITTTFTNREREWNDNRRRTLEARHNRLRRSREFKYQFVPSREKAEARVQTLGLARGASPEAVSLLKKVRQESQYLDKALRELDASVADRAGYNKQLELLKSRLNTVKNSIHSTSFKEDGDMYLVKVAKAEHEYWVHRLSMAKINVSDTVEQDKKDKLIQNHERSLKRLMEESPWLIKGLKVGSEFKVIGKFISRIEIEDLENSIRGRAGIVTWDEDHWKSLTNGDLYMKADEQKTLFLSMLNDKIQAYESIKSQYEDRYGLETLTNTTRDQVLSDYEKQAARRANSYNISARTDMYNLIKKFRDISNDLHAGSITLEDAKAKVNNSLINLDTTAISEVFLTRSSPTGGMEHQRQMFGVLRNLSEVNKAQESIETDIDKGLLPSYQLFKSDTDRNQTLTLIRPLSQVTMTLGDFDGDPYTAIFSGMTDMSNTSQKIQDKITAIDIKIRSLDDRKRKVEADIRVHDIPDLQFLSRYNVYYPKKDQATLYNENRELDQKISNLKEARSQAVQRRKQIDLKISAARDMLDPVRYNKALRKDTANYMGLNYGIFEGNNQVGINSALFDIETSILPTLIEQGSGLFSGIEGKGSSLESIRSMLDPLIQSGSSINQEFVQIRKDRTELGEFIDEMARRDGKGRNNYLALSIINEAKDALIDEILTQFGSVEEEITVQDYSRRLSELSNSVYQSLSGLKESQSKISQASGITLEYSTYDFITKVLGKAGGDLLGKTYNTLIGTLYSDAPLVAMAHAMGLDLDDPGDTRRDIQDSIRSSIGIDDAEALFDHVRSSYDQAAATQGFMKNIHQLLRDSIKFKSDSGDLRARLSAKAAEYDAADAEDRERIITEMTSSLGPGPGLSAIMNLNTLILQRDKIEGFKASDDDKVREYLSSTFGMSSFGSVDRDGNLIATNVDSFTAIANEYASVSGRDRNNVSLLDVVNYKVSEDLKTLVSAYRYEKYVNEAKAGVIASYGYLEKEAINAASRSSDRGLYEWMKSINIIYSQEGNDYINVDLLKSSRDIHYEGKRLETVLNEVISNDLTRWYQSLPDNKRRRVTEVSGTSFTGDDLSLAEKGVIRQLIEEEEHQSVKFLGSYGEGLERFVTLSQVRMGLAGVMSGDSTSISNKFAEADVSITMLNLATQDKLTAKAQALFFNEMVKTAGIVGGVPKKEDYQTEEAYKEARKNYEDELKTNIIKRMMGGDEEGSSSLFLGKSKEQRSHLSTLIDNFLGNSLTINNLEYEKGVDFLSQQIEDTAAGQRQSMIESIVRSNDRDLGKPQKGSSLIDIANSLIEDTGDVEAVYDLMSMLGELNLDANHPMQKYRKMQSQRADKYRSILEKDYRIVERETARAQRSSNVIDAFAPVALTLLGAAVMSGGITEDHVGQLVGAGITTIAYGKSSFATKANYSIAGSGFRLNAAIQQDGEEQGFVRYIAQEAAFTTGAIVIAPVVESAINRTVMRGIDPSLKYKDAIDSGINPLSYKMRSGAVLDVDKFSSAKAISSSVSSAVFSAVIGLSMAAVAGEMVAAPKKVKTDSAIDLAIEGLSNSIREAMNWRVAAESAEDDLSLVEDENGAEYIDAQVEIEPMEAIYESSIDPIEDFSYIHFNAPPFVMVGVTTTSQEYL